MSLVVKYPDRTQIIPTLIALAQEELEHFQQVYELMTRRGLKLVHDTQDPYVKQLMGDEFSRTRQVLLHVSGHNELLDGTPWLKESIRVRNRYIDPLNLIQIDLLRRGQSGSDDESTREELRHLTRLSINGIAAGLRNTG